VSSLAETTAWLVDIPSETGSEGRLATAIAGRLLPIYGEQGVGRVGNSLVVGERRGRSLVALFGHTDTVPSQGQGRARLEDGRLYGLGAADMKSGLAVIIHLLEDEAVRAGPFDVVGVFYAGEEGPLSGNELGAVLDHAGWLKKAELSIVLEPTGLALELGCTGGLNARVAFLGKAAHSARPWLGENAVVKAGEWLTHMGTHEPVAVEVGGLEYKEVVSVTLASGGVAHNIIPSRFECTVNFRFAPSRTLEEAEERLRELVGEVDEFTVLDAAPGAYLQETNPLSDKLAASIDAPVRAKQGWTDVAQLSRRGMAAINFGPGESAEAHQVGESVPATNIDECYRALASLLSEL
jgi:succinyl-diaminopimelate desuccinylase